MSASVITSLLKQGSNGELRFNFFEAYELTQQVKIMTMALNGQTSPSSLTLARLADVEGHLNTLKAIIKHSCWEDAGLQFIGGNTVPKPIQEMRAIVVPVIEFYLGLNVADKTQALVTFDEAYFLLALKDCLKKEPGISIQSSKTSAFFKILGDAQDVSVRENSEKGFNYLIRRLNGAKEIPRALKESIAAQLYTDSSQLTNG